MHTKETVVNVPLTLGEIELITGWYFKGYTNIDKEGPLFDRLVGIAEEKLIQLVGKSQESEDFAS